MTAAPVGADSEVTALVGRLAGLREQIGRAIVGQEGVTTELLIGLLAGGHVLLEGVPGLAKTLLVRTLARAVDATFRRIQFTPDLMPTDIVGTEVLEEDHTSGRRFLKFMQGPIFTNILLADEINRTPPKTQAALLEAMQEGEVTYGGKTYELPKPFFVLATQNPIEQSGTYPLPEAQLDRFLLLIRIGYPDHKEEQEILRRTTGEAVPEIQAVLTGAELQRLQRLVRSVHISDDLLEYASRVVRSTRPEQTELAMVKESVRWGAGPRAGQALVLTAKARALVMGRFAATLDDLKAVAAPVLRHRILVSFRAEAESIGPDAIAAEVIARVPPPRSPLG
ncbi:MAG: MoxR family ATPase [Gemmatimonadales bacterium]|nr:MoxR family ATPase [Gemmatimonadales bacterium]